MEDSNGESTMKCCINCRKRYPGCQDHCPDIAAEKAAEQIRNEKIRKAKEKDRMDRNYIREHYYSLKRRHE